MNNEKQSKIMDYIGWLAPDGAHFNCDRYGHENLSRELIKGYCKIKPQRMKALACDDMLICMGWARIGYSTFLSNGYSIQANWKRLTDVQKSFIRDMYFEIGDSMTEDTINNLKDYEIIELFEESHHVDNKVKRLKK